MRCGRSTSTIRSRSSPVCPATADLLGSGSLHFAATDTAARWTVDLTGSEPRVAARGEEKWDAAVRGPVVDLVLALYQRRGVEGLDVSGDAGLVEKFLSTMRF